MIFIIAVVALLTLSCNGQKEQSDKKTAEDSLDVRIGVMPSLDCMPFFVAEECGLFEKEGLKVGLKMFTAQMDVDTALVGGSVDLAISDKYRVEQLTKKGTKLQQWGTAETSWVLVANKKSRLTKVDQFAGKFVGMTRFSATANLCETVFKPLGDNPPYYIQINDVNVRVKMIINSELDAAWLSEPQATMAVSRGNNIVSVEHGLGDLGQFVYRENSRYNSTKGDKLRVVYNNACDSINKKGLKAYSHEMQMYCGVDSAVVSKLSGYKFKKQ